MTKRITLTFVLIGLLASPLLAQSKPAPTVENNLYVKALFACLDANAKAYANQTNSRHDYYNVIVQQDEIITKNFPNQLGAYRIEYLDAQSLVNRYRAKKAEFPIIIIRPIENDGAKLVIRFTVDSPTIFLVMRRSL